jgi:hypothetical protein
MELPWQCAAISGMITILQTFPQFNQPELFTEMSTFIRKKILEKLFARRLRKIDEAG